MLKETDINENQQLAEEQICQNNCDDTDCLDKACDSDDEKDSEAVLDVNESNEQIHVSDDVLSKTKTELSEVKDKYLRLMAEFDNYRKRVIKEKTDLILNGGEKVLTSILPVLDDFERAEANMNGQTEVDSLKEGITLIIEKLKHTLEQNGLRRIDPIGENFNVDFHEAIAMVPGNPDELKGKVIDCVQCGYLLNDKVIRHAKVAVAE
jgi:molecular chaperone GrpE